MPQTYELIRATGHRRRRRLGRWVPLVLTCGLAVAWSVLPSTAGLAVPSAPRLTTAELEASAGPDDTQRAVDLLRRAARAHARVAYTGTLMVSAWGSQATTTLMAHVRHLPREGTSFRVLGGEAESSAAEFVAERDVQQGSRSALEGNPLRLLISNYSLRVSGHGRVVGRRAVVVTARHEGVATARFWIDAATGLLLRREVYTPQRTLFGLSAFVDLRIQQLSVLQHQRPALPQPLTAAMSVAARSRVTAQGWSCPARLPRGFTLTDVAPMAGTPPAVHSAYSDGLSTVSVFQQHGSLDSASLGGYSRLHIDGAAVYVRPGLPSYATWAARGSVYTVITDAPTGYVREVVLAYPHREAPTQTGLVQRILRGAGRLLGWVVPLSPAA